MSQKVFNTKQLSLKKWIVLGNKYYSLSFIINANMNEIHGNPSNSSSDSSFAFSSSCCSRSRRSLKKQDNVYICIKQTNENKYSIKNFDQVINLKASYLSQMLFIYLNT